jgi:hypothetical protein
VLPIHENFGMDPDEVFWRITGIFEGTFTSFFEDKKS